MELTVLTGDKVPMQSAIDRHASRYLVLPDGSLHYAPGPGPGAAGTEGAARQPALARILSRRQMSDLWSLARQLGLADSPLGDEPFNFRLIEAQADEVVCMAAFTAHEQSWSFIRRAKVHEPSDPAMAALITHLARLAWVEPPAAPSGPTFAPAAPQRYDFGPDPYERFRR
jgi:hypothetical protein